MRVRRRQPACPAEGRAFSLVEMAAVLAIVGILAAIAVPRFNGALANHRADAAGRRIIADLTLARAHAMRAGSTQTVTFAASSGNYTLTGMADPDHPAKEYQANIAEEPYRAIVFKADFGGSTDVVFDMYGVPQSGGFVAIEAGNQYRLITVDPDTGKATVSRVTAAEIP